MMNLLTFDLEDWRPLADEWVSGTRTEASGRVPAQVDRIRRILDNGQVRATFFCLGATAAAYPETVIALARDGHEIASHGYSHTPVYHLTPEEFEKDLLRAQEVLAGMAGQAPRGFRAPQFSIIKKTWWAFDILVKLGFLYDSSIFPIRHRRYGVPSFKRGICEVQTSHGSLVEFPLATASWLGIRIPVAGGGYARLLPSWFLRMALAQVERENLAFTTYFHPYEFDLNPLTLSVSPTGLRHRARCWFFTAMQNLGRSFIPQKVEMLLENAEFGSCLSLLEKSAVHA
jgi:polysaccharide deacetylase family protein (PEP-CTERM system associated)